jgi:nucleoside-diphosphate-sugar epimerase
MLTISRDQINFKNKNPVALVIGAAGFIASYVCESLLAQNVNVIAIDDLAGNTEKNIEEYKKNEAFIFLKGDTSDGFQIDCPKIEYIFHIGGVEAYINGLDLSLNTMLVNSLGTYHILETCKKYNSKLLLVSSLNVYDGLLSSLSLKNYFGQSERDTKRFTYHEAKRYAEALVTEYFRKFGIDARIVRVADVYGPKMDFDSGQELAQLFKEALNGDTLTIHGDGLKILHPTYISDVVAGITKAMFVKKSNGKIYNLISQEEVNVLNIAYIIQKNSTKALKIQFTQEYEEIKFPLHRVELQQTQDDIGWRARTNLAEGVTLTLEYFYLKTSHDEKKVQTKKEKKIESPLVPALQATPVEKTPEVKRVDVSRYTTTEQKVFEDKTAPKDATQKGFNYLNGLIVCVSLFIVLTMFVFPLLSLIMTSNGVINHTQEALSAESKSQREELTNSTKEALKDIYLSNTQFDNLEWFFNIIQKREKFEGTRSLIQSYEKLNQALIGKVKTDDQAAIVISNVLKGQSSYEETASLKQQLDNTLLLMQKSGVDTQSATDTFFDSSQSTRNAQIVAKINDFSRTIQKQNAITQNVLDFTAPKNAKKYLVLLQDATKPDFNGGKFIGYVEIQVTNAGIKDSKFTPYAGKIDQNANLNDLVSAIVLGNNQLKSVGYDAMFMTNTNMLKKLLASVGHINATEYAESVDATKLEERLTKQTASPQFQINVWKEVWETVAASDQKTLTQLTKAFTEGIKQKDILNIKPDTAGKILYPLCDYDNALVTNFIDPLTTALQLRDKKPQCFAMRESRLTDQQEKELEKSVQVTSLQDEAGVKTEIIIKIKNNSAKLLSEEYQIAAPPLSKLIDLQIIYPISFDKVKTDKAGNQVTYTLPVEIESKQEKEIKISLLDKNPIASENAGLFISLPYGTQYTKLTSSLTTPAEGTTTNSTSDHDLLLFPTKK